jgi:hypothetical protein
MIFNISELILKRPDQIDQSVKEKEEEEEIYNCPATPSTPTFA